jgi:hypothetical protein
VSFQFPLRVSQPRSSFLRSAGWQIPRRAGYEVALTRSAATALAAVGGAVDLTFDVTILSVRYFTSDTGMSIK